MNYKTKVLFLFGILLVGIGLSYFLGETFMEGFDTKAATTTAATTPAATTAPAATTPAATTPAPAATTPAPAATTKAGATTPAATTAPAATPAATTPAAAKKADTTPTFASIAALASPMFSSLASPVQKTYDNYNHYKDMTSTQYYGSTGSPINPITEDDEEISYNPEPDISEDTSADDDYGTQYYSALPPGIPASQIMPGDEHLYILKSEIVPPVCPVCPSFSTHNKESPPPCPPCGRCPEASFECKKVPNYNAVNDESIPIPVLNDFSSFGM